MKGILLSFIFAFVGSVTAPAAQVEWLGYFCITNSLSAACRANGTQPGECTTLRYSPANIGSNGPSTRLSLYEQHWAVNYTLPSGSLIGTEYKQVNGTGIAKGVWTFYSQMRIANHTPVTATSDSVSMDGSIRNYDGARGCNINFRAAATRRPPY